MDEMKDEHGAPAGEPEVEIQPIVIHPELQGDGREFGEPVPERPEDAGLPSPSGPSPSSSPTSSRQVPIVSPSGPNRRSKNAQVVK